MLVTTARDDTISIFYAIDRVDTSSLGGNNFVCFANSSWSGNTPIAWKLYSSLSTKEASSSESATPTAAWICLCKLSTEILMSLTSLFSYCHRLLWRSWRKVICFEGILFTRYLSMSSLEVSVRLIHWASPLESVVISLFTAFSCSGCVFYNSWIFRVISERRVS